MIYPSGQITYRVYENGEVLPGVVKATMPSTKYKAVQTEGAGILGTVDIPLAGLIDPMTLNMEFSSHDTMITLGSNKWHDIMLYEATQHFNDVSMDEEIRGLRFELSIRPIETSMGDVQAHTAQNPKASFSVRKYAVYQTEEGKKDIELIFIDPFACIHRVNGEDCAKKIRKAIGMV